MGETTDEKIGWLRSLATDEQIRSILCQRDHLLKVREELQRQLVEATAELRRLRWERDQLAAEGLTTFAWAELPESMRQIDLKKAEEALSFAAEPEPIDWNVETSIPPPPLKRKVAPRQMTVLVADDNTVVRFLWRKLLERAGKRVVLAENGLDAVKLAQSELPDIIFMDVNMPLLNGFDATRRLREFPGTMTTPIIAFSATDTPEIRSQAHDAGCNDFVTKQINLDQLDAVLNSHTGGI